MTDALAALRDACTSPDAATLPPLRSRRPDEPLPASAGTWGAWLDAVRETYHPPARTTLPYGVGR